MFGLAGWDAWTQKYILDSKAYLVLIVLRLSSQLLPHYH